MSAYWFETLDDVLPSHLISTDVADFPPEAQANGVAGRTMLCRRAEMLPIECIVRGYLSGSAWKEYKSKGTMHGQVLPAGLRESDKLPEPVFTPSTKAESGHDENISYDQAVELVGSDLAEQARDASLELYRRASEAAAEKGIIIADTKFEMGLVDGTLVVADEVLTPDSSRFLAGGRLGAGGNTLRRTTNSRCATTSAPWTGTSSTPRHRCLTRWWQPARIAM